MKNQWPDDIVRMLENWARWLSGDRRRNSDSDISPFPAYNLAPRPPRAGNVLPTLLGEAEEVNAVIVSLTHRYQHPLRMNYCWPDTADRVNAKRCSCCLNTYKERLNTAHTLFAQAWYARKNRVAEAGTGVRLGRKGELDCAA